VECLKWQAYLALRGLTGIKVRWDIAPEGTVDGSLPNLHVPITESLGSENSQKSEDGDILAARSIPSWVDMKLGIDSSADPLEGYKDQEARVESRAWVSLLEDVVHAALVRIS
jgi:metaxin